MKFNYQKIRLMKNRTVGALNFTNPGLISHNAILEMYKEIVDPDFEWKNFTEMQQSRTVLCNRTNNYLDTTRLETLCPEVLNIKDSVRKVLYEYKKNYFYSSESSSPSNDSIDHTLENTIIRKNLILWKDTLSSSVPESPGVIK